MGHSGGVKNDGGKPRLDLLSTIWLWGVARVLTFGANKYAPDNWRKGIAFRRLISSAMRHLTAFADGEDLDPESGLSHLDHASCCLMFLRELSVTRPDLDDRYLVDTGEFMLPPSSLELFEPSRPAQSPPAPEPPAPHLNHPPETKAELHDEETIAEAAGGQAEVEQLPERTIEEILAQKWAETGVEHCRCCLLPRQECLTRSWMNAVHAK